MQATGTSLKQRVIRYLVRQAHRPRGIVGRANGLMFAHRPSNRKRNIWAVSLLDIRPTDRVLEIGFGPGIAVAEFAGRATRGHVFGVDHSAVMVRQATRRNAAAVRARRVHLTCASVEELPDFGDPLDAILAVNSVGFWPDPVERLRELRHLLRPAGRIALVSQPRCPGATRDTTARAAHELQDLLTQAGFTHLRVETLDLDPPVACVLAENPTGMP
ncbi:methyltransferase domain-containing protein [Nonomuraea phyllanthi]|uniref:Methyltransferase domain-containing protein n=1 Tax=Nonomuraea phyllanthi TaxID=2219224 RepID=A0A5C4WKP7_9ACTN|nr:class I SAM-dependent methyltransferase [Nonomuraea phyllanthi]KAB8194774.1 methyltransferase domain-containing protein [Nonomuraea phyllanthi]QFY09195.1 methyltransferase domain-containing protein [Nonomuraea phyllanthi]